MRQSLKLNDNYLLVGITEAEYKATVASLPKGFILDGKERKIVFISSVAGMKTISQEAAFDITKCDVVRMKTPITKQNYTHIPTERTVCYDYRIDRSFAQSDHPDLRYISPLWSLRTAIEKLNSNLPRLIVLEYGEEN